MSVGVIPEKKLMANSVISGAWYSDTDDSTYEEREIGRFLKFQRLKSVRREFPELPRTRRHVPYLTQGELAYLSDVSEVTISQIESVRYPNFNQPLLRRICQALRLSAESETYVVSLLAAPRGLISLGDELPKWVTVSVDGAAPNPAVLINPGFDILYWNDAALKMLGDFSQAPPETRNIVASMFGIPEMREVWADWPEYASTLVAGLKMQYSLVPDYRIRIMDLAQRMQAQDSTFARLWNEVDPVLAPAPEKDLHHPAVGTLRLYQTVSQVIGAPHLSLMQFSPRDEETTEAFKRM
jgi:DNA-binding XRE family transcriptional regulator